MTTKIIDPEVTEEFNRWLAKPEIAIPVAAVKALTGVIKRTASTTVMELEVQLRDAADQLKNIDVGMRASVSLDSGTDLFLRYVTRCYLEFRDFDELKAQLVERGEAFADKSLRSRAKIAELGQNFVRDGATVLVHGFSRVVLALLVRAANVGNKNFNVIATEGRPDGSGCLMARLLVEAGIPVEIIADTAVAHMMEQIDLVLVGAEAVVESGGTINAIGTYQTAIVARAQGVPFYVAAESYKFSRLFPLNQRDLPEKACTKIDFRPVRTRSDFFSPQVARSKSRGGAEDAVSDGAEVEDEADALRALGVEAKTPTTDYTPAEYITLLLTDLGVLTPSAVSDELIKLYQ